MLLAAHLAAAPAQAIDFSPHNILRDDELFSTAQPSRTAIQQFLEREGSVLAVFQETVAGVTKSTAQIIYDTAVANGISAKFLLATLEKEKGLLSKKTASESDLNWATGYSCTRGSCNEKYKGFSNQVESTAITQAIYRAKASTFGFRVGATAKTHDGIEVTPANQATANLYIYTPYTGNAPGLPVTTQVGGNYLFWKIWNRYFPTQLIPDGTVVTSNGEAWRIEGGKKRKFISDAVLRADYREADLTPVDSTVLATYPDGPIIALADNTLVRSAENNTVYLTSGAVLRPLADDAALAALSNYRLAVSTLAEVPAVDSSALASYLLGDAITAATPHPQGSFYTLEDGSRWYVQHTLKHPVEEAVWTASYAGRRVAQAASASQFSSLPVGSPVSLAEGALVRTPANVYYVISQGERRKIEDGIVARRIFGEARVNAAAVVPMEILERHPAGLNIDYMDTTVIDSAATTPVVEAGPTAVYSGIFASQDPDGLSGVTGQTLRATVRIRNTGNVNWERSAVWLMTEGNSQRAELVEASVAPGSEASFAVQIVAPTTPGVSARMFSLYRADQPATPFLQFGRFLLVKAGVISEIQRHNVPVAVRRAWKPVTVTFTIKNTGSKSWVARKTALKLTAADGSASPFYDPSDWVRRDVVAVAVNKATIAPGEVGVFTFTLKASAATRGVHTLRFTLERTDTKEAVLLSGESALLRQLRVD